MNESILIVDDEQKIREVIREYSEFNGYEVEEAAEVAETETAEVETEAAAE